MGAQIKHKKISILSFNTLGTPFFAPYITKRYRKIAEFINTVDVDIVCLQEVFTYYHFYLLKNKLKNFPFVIYQKNVCGPAGGLVIFSKEKLTDAEFNPYSYPKGTYVPLYTKIARHGFLSAQFGQFPLRIATTHLSSDKVHKLKPENKLYKLIRSQSQSAADAVNKYTEHDESIILAGDFNIAKNSELYRELVDKAGLIDVFAGEETPTYYPDRVSYFYKAPADRCDFIFAKAPRKKLKIHSTNYAFVEKEPLSNGELSYLSDHIGLHCILEVSK